MASMRLVRVVLGLALTVGCSGGVGPPPPPIAPEAPSVAPTADAAPPVAATAPGILPNRQGLAEDAPLLVATRKLAGCEITGSPFDLENSCPHYAAWKQATPSMRSKDDDQSAIDVTLVRLTHDPDVRVRRAAAFTLDRAGMQFKFDADLADAVLTAAEAERDPVAARELGHRVAVLHLDLPGVFERTTKLGSSHPSSELRLAIVSDVLFASRMLEVREPKKVYDFVAGMLKNGDPKVRRAAVSAFWVGSPRELDAETCKLWKAAAEDVDEEVGSAALDLLVRKPCLAEHAWALGVIQRRMDSKAVRSGDSFLIDQIAKSDQASPADKKLAERLQAKLRAAK